MGHFFALVLAFSFAAFASAQSGEIISWQRYKMMNVKQRQLYLKLVTEALVEFETSQNKLLNPENVANTETLREWIAANLQVLPDASADPDPRICYQHYSFEKLTTKSCYFYTQFAYTTMSGEKFPAKKVHVCSSGSGWGYADFKAQKELCEAEFAKKAANDAKKAAAANKSVVAQPPEPPEPPVAMAPAAATQTVCNSFSPKDLAKAREAYRSKKDSKCLIGGVFSSYDSKNPNSPCKVVQKEFPNGPNVCTKENRYPKDATTVKLSKESFTVCDSVFFCNTTNPDKPTPFCIKATKNTLNDCINIAATAGLTFDKEGQNCAGGDEASQETWTKRFLAFRNDVNEVCDPNGNGGANSILCNDCKNLRDKLGLAEATTAAPAPPVNPAPTDGHSAN
jgi:hypothetical protein